MWFYKSLCVLILANVTVKVLAEYFVSNDSTDWRLANCNLAEPKLSYIDESFHANETLGVHINVPEVWIGYQQAKIPFLFLGCGELNTSATYTVTNIGVCFNLCGNRPFGIRARSDYDVVRSNSTLECKCPNGSYAAISQNCIPATYNICERTCFSIYDQLNVNESYVRNPKNATEECLTYFFPSFQWSPCEKERLIRVMCSRNSYEDMNSTASIVPHSATSWVDGMAFCMRNGLYPASTRSILNSGFGYAQAQYYWTGVVRASMLLKKSSIGNLTPYQDVQYAFLTTNDATLQFAANGSKRSLCLRETETTPMSPPTSSVANTLTQFSSTTVSTKEDMQDGVLQSKTSSRDFLAIGVGIGVPIGFILAIGGVVAIGLLRKEEYCPVGRSH